MTPQYFFVVGLPRTGTKLMMNVLENCQEKKCKLTVENFFMGRVLRPGVRQKMKRIGDLSLDSNVHKLVEYMYSGKFHGEYWDSLLKGSLKIDRELMLQRLLASDRSERAIYSIIMEIHTEVDENTILGDKSGPNLYHLPTVLAWFPEAKFIHTFRDPRAVLASEHKRLMRKHQRKINTIEQKGRKFLAYWLRLTGPIFSLIIVLYVTLAWIYAVRLHYKYKKLYPNNYYLSQFEELVTKPEESIRKLCEFLKIEFHISMLSPPRVDSSYSREKGKYGFDKGTLNRWEGYIQPWMEAGLLTLGRKYLREFGYLA